MREGFTLLEVVVALLLLEVAVLGAVGTLTVASRTLAEAERTERAVVEAGGVIDSLAGVAAPADGARPVTGGVMQWSVGPDGSVRVGVTGDDGRVWLDATSALPVP